MFEDILQEMANIYHAKNADYGDSFARSFEQFGITAAVVRIGDKYNRLCELTKPGNTAQVKSETVRDTLLDQANYCIMTIMEIDRRGEEKPDTGYRL